MKGKRLRIRTAVAVEIILIHVSFTNRCQAQNAVNQAVSDPSVELQVSTAWPWEAAFNVIAANSPCEIHSAEKRARITVITQPAGYESQVSLSIQFFQTTSGSCVDAPEDQGTLVKVSNTQWEYIAYRETIGDLHPPELSTATISAKLLGSETIRSEIQIRIYSAFQYLNQFAARKKLDGDAGASYSRAYSFIRCKYGFLKAVGDDFDSIVFSSQVSFPVAGNPIASVPAFTVSALFTYHDEVTFGTVTWSQESAAASLVGHELIHTSDLGIFAPGECPAYEWEADNAHSTGIDCGTGSHRVGQVQELLGEYECE